jgi:tripartite-type tricarboxylate transporter receptor subunit TctC
MKLLALVEPSRIKKMPQLTTINEVVPGVEVTSWVAIFAAGATPRPIIERLNAALNKVLSNPEVQNKLDRIGVVPTPIAADDLDKRLREDLKFWKATIAEVGIAPQ